MKKKNAAIRPELSSPARCIILGGSTERDGWTEEILVSNIGYQVQASQLREANITTKSNKRPWPEGIY